MAPAGHYTLASWPATALMIAVLVISEVGRAAAVENVGTGSKESALLPMDTSLAECFDNLFRNASHLCAESTNERVKILISALDRCFSRQMGIWTSETCHKDSSADVTDTLGSQFQECRELKAFKSSSTYSTVLTSLLSTCSIKESIGHMFDISAKGAATIQTENLVAEKDLDEELQRLSNSVDAVYILILEQSFWINMIFYYTSLTSLFAIATMKPSVRHHRWKLLTTIVFTVMAEKFLCFGVLCLVNTSLSKMALNGMRWIVRCFGLATSLVLFIISILPDYRITFQVTSDEEEQAITGDKQIEIPLALSALVPAPCTEVVVSVATKDEDPGLEASSDLPGLETDEETDEDSEDEFSIERLLKRKFSCSSDTDDEDYLPPDSSDSENDQNDQKDNCDDAISGDAISGDAISGDAISGDAISGDAISGDAISGDAISDEEIPDDEIDLLLDDLKNPLDETVTAEYVNLSYTLSTYVRSDRTFQE